MSAKPWFPGATSPVSKNPARSDVAVWVFSPSFDRLR